MIDKIEVSGTNYKPSDNLQKYVKKHIGKLDRYLPRQAKKDVVVKVVIAEVEQGHGGNKYEISAAMEITGGKVIAAKDECSNVFAGTDIVEAKLMGQVRRYKLESTPHLRKDKSKKRGLKDIFKRS